MMLGVALLPIYFGTGSDRDYNFKPDYGQGRGTLTSRRTAHSASSTSWLQTGRHISNHQQNGGAGISR